MPEMRNALTSGVLDPLLKDRHDLKQYNAGLEKGVNIEFLPQGGVRNRAGHAFKQKLRNQLIQLNVNAPALSKDVQALPQTFISFDQGLVQTVAFIDLYGIYGDPETLEGAGSTDSTGTEEDGTSASGDGDGLTRLDSADGQDGFLFNDDVTSPNWDNNQEDVTDDVETYYNQTLSSFIPNEEETEEEKLKREEDEAKALRELQQRNGQPVCLFTVEYSLDGSSWTQLGPAHDLTRTPRTRRFALSMGSVLARHWRIQLSDLVVGAEAPGVARLGAIRIWAEIAAESPVKLFNNGLYTLAITDRNVDIFRDGVWQAAIPGDAVAGQIAMLTHTQELDTILLFHPDIYPVRLKKQGSPDSWNHDFPSFKNLPDDVMGHTLGWPRCGTFYQSRLILAGFRSAPDVILFSVNGDIFNFDKQEGDLATDAMQYRVDAGFPQIIYRIFVGRHLQFFTDQAEWFIEARTVDATKPLNVVLATRHGIRPGAGVHFIEGSTVFVQKTGTVLRDFLFSDAELSYKAEAITLLASHLLTNVVDIAVRRAAETSEGNLVFLINADGSMTLLTLLRSQSVVAAAQCITDGDYLAADVDDNDEVWLAVRRNGQICLEHWDTESLLDGAKHFYYDSPTQIISGLAHLEGKQVWAVVDGNPWGPDIVQGGQIILDRPASQVEVGLLPELIIRPLPMVQRTRAGDVLRRKRRIHTVWLSLMGTGDLSLSANDGPARPVPLRSLGKKVLDMPMMGDLFTGEKVLYNRKGCGYHPTIELTRTMPAPVLVRSIIMEG